MAFRLDAMSVLLVVAMALVGAGAIGIAVLDDGPAHLELVVHGEGTTDPAPGVYSFETGSEIDVVIDAADGWIISMVTVNGEVIEYGEHNASLTIDMGSDKKVDVYFITYEVELPAASGFVFTGDEIVAYEDNQFYTVSDASAVDAGSYGAVFSLRHPDFCHWSDGSNEDKVVTWTIDPKEVQESDFESIADEFYTGEQICPVPSSIAPMMSDDFVCTYGDNTAVGIGQVFIEAKGNYVGQVTLDFNILMRVIITADSAEKVYDGTALIDDGYTAGPLFPGDSIQSISVSGSRTVVGSSDNVVGDVVIVRGSDVMSSFYVIDRVKGSLTVTPYTLTQGDFEPIGPQYYTGSNIRPDIVPKSDVAKTLIEGTDYNVAYSDNDDIGTANVLITGIAGNNSMGSVSMTFDIYSGLSVYVTKDIHGNVCYERLSSFTGDNALFDMINIVPDMVPQTVTMKAIYEGSYAGMHLGLVVKYIEDASSPAVEALAKAIVLTVERDGISYSGSIHDAKGGIIDLGEITGYDASSGSDTFTVSLSFPSSDGDSDLEDITLVFEFGLCLWHV